MAFKVIRGFIAKLFARSRVSADRGSVAVGGSNYGPIKVFHVSNTPPEHLLDDLDGYLVKQARRQLESEKHSGKYIPDVFIETRESKNLARTFSHPFLFFGRTLSEARRLSVPSANRFLARAGLPSLPHPDVSQYDGNYPLNEIGRAANQLSAALSETLSMIEELRKEGRSLPIKAGCEGFFSENAHQMQTFGWGLAKEIEERQRELSTITARVFMLIGRAGQGKTNFVCDFVENFLFKHGIPCAYITGRRISAQPDEDFGETVRKLTFPDVNLTFHDVAKLLSAHAEAVNKPFVLIIDGINEHRRIGSFSTQLESFVESVLDYPNIKLLLTCRSEFFDQRFGNLLAAPFASSIFVQRSPEHMRDQDRRHDDLQAAYFAFFKVEAKHVSRQVLQALTNDILLLRFFCEAYGARNKSADYRQPTIRNLYREAIFKTYLEKKLGAADLFIQGGSNQLSPIGALPKLVAVLGHIIEHMLKTGKFGDVPISVVPDNLHDAFYGLLDEELVLRRDAPEGESVFSPSQETVNFTFDEFRDYLLAQYLVDRIFKEDVAKFQKYVGVVTPLDSEAMEGMKRYLFYASRDDKHKEFFGFFRQHPWYSDAYPVEIFNVDNRLLQPADCDLVLELLRCGGNTAIDVARSLAVRWQQQDNPLLNLGFLISYASQLEDEDFKRLVVGAFRTVQHSNDGTSATAFCAFITKNVLPNIDPTAADETVLIQFLILLFPVDHSPNLENECVATFRSLMEKFPGYGSELLVGSLAYKCDMHKPYVWRLMTQFAREIPAEKRSMIDARIKDGKNSDNPALHRELDRFVARLNAVRNE